MEDAVDVKALVDLKSAFDSYALDAAQFDLSPEKMRAMHAVIGLCAEAGEVAGKFQKAVRDKGGVINDEDRLAISRELGDVLWFVAAVARVINVPFHAIPLLNLEKLYDRRERGTERGSGDNR